MDIVQVFSLFFVGYLCEIVKKAVAYQAPGAKHVVCTHESFQARCPPNQFIIMQTSLYGRMGQSRCFEDDEDLSHCSGSVLGISDRLCSGKRECKITMPYVEFDSTMDCFKKIRVYFEGSYSCMKVSGLSNLCKPSHSLHKSTSPLIIASHDVKHSPCSNIIRSLEIHAKPGQQINVTLLDFMWTSSQIKGGCINYGDVIDKQTQRRTRLCGGQQRESVAMLSISSSVKLELLSVGDNFRYMLTFQAIGCEDLSPPAGAWMNRSYSEITMGCQASGQVWHLRCVQGRWAGQIQKCLDIPVQHEERVEESSSVILPNDIIITIIAAVAFLLAVAIVTTGVICYKRSERKKQVLLQQQKLVFQTLKAKARNRNSTLEEATYMSPTFVQPERPPGQAHRPDSAYESIQVFSRTLPSASSASNTMTASMIRQIDEDTYNASQSSSSTYTNPLKYFVLDKNLVVSSNNA